MKNISPYYTHFLKTLMYLERGNKENAYQECTKGISYKDNYKIRYLQYTIGNQLNNFDYMFDASNGMLKNNMIEGYVFLGTIYSTDNQFNKHYNPKKAFECFDKGASLKDPLSIYFLADANNEKYLSLLEKGLKTKNINVRRKCAYELGEYYDALGEYKIAAKYFKKALKYGELSANRYLATYYINGKGVRSDLDKYMEYLTASFDNQTNLMIASFYLFNKTSIDVNDLIEHHLLNSAKQGNPTAAFIYALSLSIEKEPRIDKIKHFLKVGFKLSQNDEGLQKCCNEIETLFGSAFKEEVEKIAEKYWNIKEYEA